LDWEKRDSEIPRKTLEGKFNYLDVVFPGTTARLPGRLVDSSNYQDVALVKVDRPHPLQPVELLPAGSLPSQGDAVTVIGYPATSPSTLKQVANEGLSRNRRTLVEPHPSLSVGTISKLPEGNSASSNPMANFYQLSNSSGIGHGSSGGPVFDPSGRVIGLLTVGETHTGLTWAVPIQYGSDLLSPPK
jgi:S1-C subfamily serine protease